MALDKETSEFIECQNQIMRTHMTEIIGLNTTVISARLDNKMDEKLKPIIEKLDRVVNHQEKQNGWIQDHSLKIEANLDNIEANASDISELQVCVDGSERLIGFMKKRWYVLFLSFAAFILGMIWLSHNIDFIKTLENKTGIEIRDTNTTN